MKVPDCPMCDVGAPYVRPAPVGTGFVCSVCGNTFRPEYARTGRAGYASSTRARSSRQEKHNARRVGGELTANSGAGSDKGDVKVRGVLREEDKTTLKSSFSLKLADLNKNEAAAKGDEIPVMRISFEDDLSKQYVVVHSDWFNALLTRFRETS